MCIGSYVACTMGACCSVCLWLWGPDVGLNQGEGPGSAVTEVSSGGARSLLQCPVLHMGAVPAKLA